MLRVDEVDADEVATEPGAPIRALIVDDSLDMRFLLEPLLLREGFAVEAVGDGEAAVEMARTFNPDVIILDVLLHGMSGLEACRQIRVFSDAYIVIATAMNTELDKVVGLSIGADDYVAKPFSPNELIARLRAMLRRPRRVVAARGAASVYTFGPLVVDTTNREVQLNGGVVDLSRIEFDVLATLCFRPRLVFTRHHSQSPGCRISSLGLGGFLRRLTRE